MYKRQAVHTPIQAKVSLLDKYKSKINKLSSVKHKNAAYATMVESVDQAVGRIREKLSEYDLSKNTVIIFTSDNGGLLGPTNNAPLRSGKGYPYEGGIRVPLIVHWPGVIKVGGISSVPVSSVDYFPTICAAAGVALPSKSIIDGFDLKSLMEGLSLIHI